jgi:hypothetical protein
MDQSDTTKHMAIPLSDSIGGQAVLHSAFWVEENKEVHYIRRGDDGHADQTSATASTYEAAVHWVTAVVGAELAAS